MDFACELQLTVDCKDGVSLLVWVITLMVGKSCQAQAKTCRTCYYRYGLWRRADPNKRNVKARQFLWSSNLAKLTLEKNLSIRRVVTLFRALYCEIDLSGLIMGYWSIQSVSPTRK